MGKKVREELAGYLHIDTSHVFQSTTPLDLSFVSQLQDFLRNKRNLFLPPAQPPGCPRPWI